MNIITISGLDGSGKSTQIEFLKEYLTSQDKKVFYFHAVAFSIATKISEFKAKYCLVCKLLGKCQIKNSKIEKSVTRANAFQIYLRKVFLKIDLWRFDLLHSKLRNKNYDYIVSDRYFYDTVVNIEYLERKRKPEFDSGSPESNSGFPPANLAIYLQTSPEKIMSRDRVPDQGLEYLEKKKEIYDRRATEWKMKIINGDQRKEEVFGKIEKLMVISK